MGKHRICSLVHTPPSCQELRLSIWSAVQSRSHSAFIPTLNEALERGTSRLLLLKQYPDNHTIIGVLLHSIYYCRRSTFAPSIFW
jgi:hypothetical protein